MQLEFSKFWGKFWKSERYAECGSMWRMADCGLSEQQANEAGKVSEADDSSSAIPLRTCPYPVVSRTPPCRQERTSVPPRRKLKNAERIDWRRWLKEAGVRRSWSRGSRAATSRDQVSSSQKNHQRASFFENANEPFGENLCVGLRASKSLYPPRFRWGQKDPSLTHILLRESLPWWKHWRSWSSAPKNLDQTLPTVCSN